MGGKSEHLPAASQLATNNRESQPLASRIFTNIIFVPIREWAKRTKFV